jgi:hypothetical protein
MHILAVDRVVALLFAVSMEHMHLFAWDAGIYGYPVEPLFVVIIFETGSVFVMWIGSLLLAK